MKPGYVIARNNAAIQFFTAKSSYDRPIWTQLGEATIYYSDAAAQAAVKKLWTYGSYSSAVRTLAEFELIVEPPLTTMSAPVSGPLTPVPDQEVTEVCPSCGANPCVCVAAIQSICKKCGEQGHAEENCELTPVPMNSIPGQSDNEYEERAFVRTTFQPNEHVKYTENPDKTYQVIQDDPGNGLVSIRDANDPNSQPFSVKITQIIKEGELELQPMQSSLVSRTAHDTAAEREWRAKPGSQFFIRTARGHYGPYKTAEEAKRVLIAMGLTRLGKIVVEAFVMPAKPMPDAQPEENTNLIPDLKQPKIHDLTYKDPSTIIDRPDTDLTTALAWPHDMKVKVPAEVMTALRDRKNDFQKCADYNNGRDDSKASFCMTCQNALEELEEYLNTGTVESLKQAQIKMSSWMNPITTNIPEIVRQFVYRGGMKPSLRDLFDIKKGEKMITDVSKGLNYPKGTNEAYMSPKKFFVIKGDKVNTSDPIASSWLVKDWETHGPMTYLFVSFEIGGRGIIGGSGSPRDYDVQQNTPIVVMDDGNGTTKFGRKYGKRATVLQVATGADQMLAFPKGVFTLYAMK